MNPRLQFFKPAEFQRGPDNWFFLMDTRLLVMLDLLRFQHGKPIHLSSHPAALGRHLGDSLSQHNIDRWGEVRAADIIPEGINDQADVYGFLALAEHIGFTGLGFYPDWEPSPGFHVDTRDDKQMGEPSTWGYLRTDSGKRQVSLTDAIDEMEVMA